jgi:four helix bundle protein
MADELAERVYQQTRSFPREERFALQLQIRRAAVSVAANLVEGSARRSEAEYLHFVSIALGSAAETRYLIDLASRLGFIENAGQLTQGYERVARALSRLIASVSAAGQSPKPKAQSPS